MASSSFSSTSDQATRWARRWACRRLPRSLRRRGLPPALCSSGSRGRGWATWPATIGSSSLFSASWPAVGKRGTTMLSSSPIHLMAGEQHPGSLTLFHLTTSRLPLPTAQSPSFQDHSGLYNPDPHLGPMQQDHLFPPACVNTFLSPQGPHLSSRPVRRLPPCKMELKLYLLQEDHPDLSRSHLKAHCSTAFISCLTPPAIVLPGTSESTPEV